MSVATAKGARTGPAARLPAAVTSRAILATVVREDRRAVVAARAPTGPPTSRNAKTAEPGADQMVVERRVLDAPPRRADAEKTTIAVSGRSAATGKARDERGIRGETSQAAPAVNAVSRTGVIRLAAGLGLTGRSVPDRGDRGQRLQKRAVGSTGVKAATGGIGSTAGTATAPAGAVGIETTDQVAVERIAALAKTTERAGRVIDPTYGRSPRAGSRRTGRPPRRCRTT